MKQKKIKFYKKSHKYKLGRVELISVTRFISGFFPKFDAKGIAKKIAAGFKYRNYKNGVKDELSKKKATQRYWLSEWKEAAAHGTRVHEHLENFVDDEDYEPHYINKKDMYKVSYGMDWIENIIEHQIHPMIMETEKVIFDEELLLAGTIDLLIKEGEEYYIVDWKSNKAIKPEHIEKYSLQLSMYRYMLERQGYNVTKLIIVHLKEDSYEEIEVDYMKDKIEEMLNENKRLNK